MNGKIIQLEYISPRCIVCGRDLPAGRRQKCCHCMPPWAWRKKNVVEEEQEPAEYTLADRVAQADAYGMSYGQFMAYIENGWKLPKRIKPVRWPLDSVHFGEEK